MGEGRDTNGAAGIAAAEVRCFHCISAEAPPDFLEVMQLFFSINSLLGYAIMLRHYSGAAFMGIVYN